MGDREVETPGMEAALPLPAQGGVVSLAVPDPASPSQHPHHMASWSPRDPHSPTHPQVRLEGKTAFVGAIR